MVFVRFGRSLFKSDFTEKFPQFHGAAGKSEGGTLLFMDDVNNKMYILIEYFPGEIKTYLFYIFARTRKADNFTNR